MSIESKLHELGLALPDAPKPVASYLPAVRSGNLVFVSGQLPFAGDELVAHGPVPSHTSVEDAQGSAQRCVINGLAVLKAALGGDLSKVVRVVRLGVFVACDNGFADQAKVANGASEMLVRLMGEAGRHARAAVGVNALPLNAPVEVEFVFEVQA
jgi:enamine deaminase RidA (YjgF/YER057c/UK114 family)